MVIDVTSKLILTRRYVYISTEVLRINGNNINFLVGLESKYFA